MITRTYIDERTAALHCGASLENPKQSPSSMCRTALVVASFALLPTALAAQQAELDRPESWQVRTDAPGGDASEVYFVEMPPGWHVTTGPAAILWDPATVAEGRFRVETEIFLFDPEGRREGFGVFIGGRRLDGSEPAYLYFLVREGGEFLVKRRDGERTEVVVPWSAHEAVASWAERPTGEATARNVLAVEVAEDELRFSVNGEEVTRIPREGIVTDGRVGLRVNHHLNLHVSRLDVAGGG